MRQGQLGEVEFQETRVLSFQKIADFLFLHEGSESLVYLC